MTDDRLKLSGVYVVAALRHRETPGSAPDRYEVTLRYERPDGTLGSACASPTGHVCFLLMEYHEIGELQIGDAVAITLEKAE